MDSCQRIYCAEESYLDRQRKLMFKGNLLGQFCVLQVLVSVDNPEHVPPYCSVTDFDLDLVCVPPPQLLEHVEY